MTVIKPVENRLKHELARFVDEKCAEYARLVEGDELPIKKDTFGNYLAPTVILFFERWQDKR